MKKMFIILTVALINVIIVTCSKSNGPKNCNFKLDLSEKLTSNESVTYLAGVSDPASSIAAVSYLDSNGTTTVTNPVLPFTVEVNLKSGVTPTIVANGVAQKGQKINISIVVNGVQTGSECAN